MRPFEDAAHSLLSEKCPSTSSFDNAVREPTHDGLLLNTKGWGLQEWLSSLLQLFRRDGPFPASRMGYLRWFVDSKEQGLCAK
jgi:hypothetical protein